MTLPGNENVLGFACIEIKKLCSKNIGSGLPRLNFISLHFDADTHTHSHTHTHTHTGGHVYGDGSFKDWCTRLHYTLHHWCYRGRGSVQWQYQFGQLDSVRCHLRRLDCHMPVRRSNGWPVFLGRVRRTTPCPTERLLWPDRWQQRVDQSDILHPQQPHGHCGEVQLWSCLELDGLNPSQHLFYYVLLKNPLHSFVRQWDTPLICSLGSNSETFKCPRARALPYSAVPHHRNRPLFAGSYKYISACIIELKH